MIYYLAAQRHAPTMQEFLSSCGRKLVNRVSIIPYEHVLSGESLEFPPGTYILASLGSDLGSRNPPSTARQEIARLRRLLVEQFGAARVLNDPLASLRR